MSKKILITGGPSNEYIDEVMKITNMSSGRIACELALEFLAGWNEVTLLITKSVKNVNLDAIQKSPKARIVRFETTEELYNAIKSESEREHYDVVIHSAAVADYKPEFSYRAESMAAEILGYIMRNQESIGAGTLSQEDVYDSLFDILTNPICKVNDDTKISSCEPNLTVKLGLTPKIIASLREWFPDSIICGFKLLENVPQDELVDAAKKQIEKCKTDFCFANDLAELRKGKEMRLVVTPAGYNDIQVDGAIGIMNLLKIAMDR